MLYNWVCRWRCSTYIANGFVFIKLQQRLLLSSGTRLDDQSPQMTSLLAALLLLLLVAWVCSAAWQQWRRRPNGCRRVPEPNDDEDREIEASRLPLPPGNMGLPLIGEMIQFIFQASSGFFFTSRQSRHGPIFKTHILGRPTIYVAGPSAVKQILLGEHTLVEAAWPPAMKLLLGPGALSSSTGDVHRNLRRTTAACLGREFTNLHAKSMEQIIGQEIDSWLNIDKPVDVYLAAKRMTTRVAALIILGIELDGRRQRLDEVKVKYRSRRDTFDCRYNDKINKYDERNKSSEASTDDGRAVDVAADLELFGGGFFTLPLPLPGSAFSKAVSAKRRLQRLLTATLKSCRANEDDGARNVLTELFRRSKSIASNVDDGNAEATTSVDQALELLFGGQETLSGLVTCIIIMLASNSANSSVYDKMAAGALSANGHSSDNEMNFPNPYVDAVINEVLRIWPPIGGGYRIAKRTFSIDGYQVPRGWAVTYSIKGTHDVSPLFSIDPDNFDPSRWISQLQNGKEEPDSSSSSLSSETLNFQFLPFGAGARACVGRRYALLFARAFCVELARKCSSWTLTTSKWPVAMLTVPVIRPRGQVLAKFESRR